MRAAYLHDVGKANEQFQNLVAGRTRLPQALRHEVISLFLALSWEPLRGLRNSTKGEDDVVFASLFSASGHHLKLESLDLSPRRGSGESRLTIYTGHPDVVSLLEQGASRFGLPVSTSSSSLKDMRIDLVADPMRDVEAWLHESALWWQRAGGETRRFVALVKALVIGADLVASAAVRDTEIQGWASSALGKVCQRTELVHVAESALDGKPLRPFQERVKNSPARVTFVHAGCGTGKTVAAYLWAANNAPGRKVFFCYPTTGTATQGYLDYAADGCVDSRLVHSRSEVDLEMSETRGDEAGPVDSAIRYESFAAWGAPLIVATADTVLGLIQNNRRGLFSFPPICQGAFVFDEIHAYDGRLFGALLRFIEAFPGSKILLMTASLQPERLARVRELLGSGEDLEIIGGPAEFEGVKRYLLNPGRKKSEEGPWDDVARTLRQGGKVLWVTNTVDRARKFWNEARQRLGAQVSPLLLYHSRYRYIDRVEHHTAVAKSFRDKGPTLAVTTQVCEVSLDISADLLVTDFAPVPSLIQRMGRVNRRSLGGPPAPVHMIEPDGAEPYDVAELATARRWLRELIDERGASLSQADLAAKFGSYHSDDLSRRDCSSSWIDGGPISAPAPLREEGYTFSVIRGEDRSKCLSAAGKPVNREITKHVIPMPFRQVEEEIGGWERLNGVFVAPAGRMLYSEEEGGSWQ